MKSLLLASFLAGLFGLFGVNWSSVDRRIEREFPAVNEIESPELASLMERGTEASPLLVDVREAEEFGVSRLPGALNLQSAAAIAARVPNREQEIVVYCSVGYRSAAVAKQLNELGYSRVRNLRHSIFAWAEQGRPLENDQGEAVYVHPFNKVWGRLLDESLHRYPD